jgi:hypothetical protein
VQAEATGDLAFATDQAARLADVALSGGGVLGITAAAGTTLADTTLRGGSIAVAAGNGDLATTNVQAEATGDLAFATGQAVRLANATLSAGGALSITAAAGTTLADTTLRGGSIAVAAGNGDLAATNVRAEAMGDLAFAISGAGRVLRLVGGSYQGEHVVMAAGRAGDGSSTVRFSDTRFDIGTALLFAAGGGIGEAGDIGSRIEGLSTSAQPLVIFDTRRSPARCVNSTARSSPPPRAMRRGSSRPRRSGRWRADACQPAPGA